jgi:uncharacterized Tic20 family protein
MSVAVPADHAVSRRGWRLREPALDATDRKFAIAIHLTPLAGVLFAALFVTPVVLWLVRRDASAYVDDHGREMVNGLLSFALYHVLLAITVIGLVALPVLYVLCIINVVRGAVAASRGEYFRYPMTIRVLGDRKRPVY